MYFNSLQPYVVILATAWHVVEALECRVIVIIALECFSRYISLLLAPSGLECVLACQRKFSLHYAAIYKSIFELHEP